MGRQLHAELSPASEGGLETEIAVTKIAMLSPFLFEAPSDDPGSVNASSGVMVDGLLPFRPAGTPSVMARAFPFAGPSTVPSSSGVHHSSDPSTNSPPPQPASEDLFDYPVPSFDNFMTNNQLPWGIADFPETGQGDERFYPTPEATPLFGSTARSAPVVVPSHESSNLVSLRQSNKSSLKEARLVPERHSSFSEQRGPMIPQKRYKPQISADRRRHVDGTNLGPPIHFVMQHPDQEGIPLRDAMHGRFARLVARNDPMFQECGPSISIRLNVSFAPRGFCCYYL